MQKLSDNPGKFVHLSPQAFEALNTLKQLKQNKGLIPYKRSNSQLSPIAAKIETNSSLNNSFFKGQSNRNRQETEGSRKPSSQRQCSQIKSDEPTPFFRDTLSSDRNRCNQTSLSQFLARHQFQQHFKCDELQAFKQQVGNDVLIETIITKFESPQESLMKQDSQYISNRSQKENLSPTTNLMMKKKKILNQILSLDNQIKEMEDEEAKLTLDPKKKRMDLFTRAQKKQQDHQHRVEETLLNKTKAELKECTFQPKINTLKVNGSFHERLDEWVKRKNQRINKKQEISQEKMMRECTFSPLPKGSFNVSCTGVYQRNQEWQSRVNLKKLKMRQTQRSNSQYQIDLAKIHKSNNTQTTTKRIKHHSPTEMVNPHSVEIVDAKYQQLCKLAQKIRQKY